MKRPGLTEAMDRWLRMCADGRVENVPATALQKLYDAWLVDCDGKLTPRGQAALAAPMVTQSQFDLLAFLSTRPNARVRGARLNIAFNLRKDGLVVVSVGGSGEYAAITKAGTTALNNIRAASGSPYYKEN